MAERGRGIEVEGGSEGGKREEEGYLLAQVDQRKRVKAQNGREGEGKEWERREELGSRRTQLVGSRDHFAKAS